MVTKKIATTTTVVTGEPTIDPVPVRNLEAARQRIAVEQLRIDEIGAEVERLIQGKSEVERQVILDAAVKVRSKPEERLSHALGAEQSATRNVQLARMELDRALTEPAMRLVQLACPMIENVMRVGDLGTLTLVPIEAVYEPTLPGYVGSFRIVGTDSPVPAEWWEAIMRSTFRNFGVGPYAAYPDEWSTPLDFIRNYEMVVGRVSLIDSEEKARRTQADAKRDAEYRIRSQAGYAMTEVNELRYDNPRTGGPAIDVPGLR